MESKHKIATVYFTDSSLHEKAKKHAAKNGRSLSGLISDLLRAYFKKGGK